MFYHDSRHPLIYMYEPPMQKEEYQAAIDELAGTPVEALMFCLGDGRTMFHDTRKGELWGHDVKKWPHLIFRRAHQNAKSLLTAGLDPLRIVCDRAHEKGMLLYPTLLVNQGMRGSREEDVRASDYRWEHRHLEIGAAGNLDPDFPGASCLDFKYPLVRQERLSLIEEVLNNYPVDGFELQLNYPSPGPYFFHPAEIEQGRGIMTQWITQVHQLVKKSGPDRELVIRIPANIETALALGLDVKAWIKGGVVDVLVPETYCWYSGRVDHTADYRPLVNLATGSACRIHAELNSVVQSDRLITGTIEIIRAAACNYWDQGVDGLYLNQWFQGDNWPYRAPFYEQLREIPHPEVMSYKDKFYFVPTLGNYRRLPTEAPMPLPADLKKDSPFRVQLPVSDDLHRWDRAGRIHEVLLRFRIGNTTELDRLSFGLNGKPLPDALQRRINAFYRMSGPRGGANVPGDHNAYWFIYRLDRSHWPKKGSNTIEVTLTKRDSAVTPQIQLRDVEIEVKYLMGKNFHRYLDTDLGPTVLNS
jgi:hypothetical protein